MGFLFGLFCQMEFKLHRTSLFANPTVVSTSHVSFSVVTVNSDSIQSLASPIQSTRIS
jgi:hypothetical protein